MPDPVALSSLIQDACRQFRDLRQENGNTCIESFLQNSGFDKDLTVEDRRKVIGALIHCEIDTKRRLGLEISSAEYRQRFPDISIEFIEDLISLPEIPTNTQPTSKPILPVRYQIIEKIGTGGIGDVWRVHDKQMDRTMAIKSLHKRHRTNWIANQRLQREAILTGKIQHPGVPPVYEQGQLQTGANFFAMKLVEGKTLAEILESTDYETSSLINVFEQVAQTIAFAHSKNIVHRDIKPQNIMVGEFGEVQVMDWGMAKEIGETFGKDQSRIGVEPNDLHEMAPANAANDTFSASIDSSMRQTDLLDQSIGISTRMGDVMGTPAYMAPEQARGDVDLIDARSDVFALGILLFEILSKSRLYVGDGANQVIEMAANCKFEPVEEQLTGVELELVELCRECLQRNPDDRPRDANRVAKSISKYLSNVQQRLKQAEIDRSSAMIQSAEQRKRTRVIGWMSGLVATISVIGAAAFIWQSQKTTKAARNAAIESETRTEVSDFFLHDVLQQADPNSEPNRDLKVRTVLDRAAAKIDERFQDRPKVEMAIRSQLADSYFGLGEYRKAKIHRMAEHQLQIQHLGKNSDEAWRSYSDIASIESKLGNTKRALEMFTELEEVFLDKFGADSPQSLLNLSNKSSVLTEMGKFAEAEKLARQVVEQISTGNVLKADLNSNKNKIAVNLMERGKYDEAETVFQEIVDDCRQHIVTLENGSLQPKDEMYHVFDFINAQQGIALAMEFRGEFEESESVTRDLHAACEQLLGINHSMTIEIVNNLTISLLNQRKAKEAKTILDQYVPISIEMLGSHNGLTTRLKNSLAACSAILGDLKSAEKLFLEFQENLAQIHGDELHHNVIANHHNLGALYYRMKKYEQSVEQLSIGLEQSEKLLGLENPRTLITMADLARSQGKLKQYEDSEKTFLRSLELGKEVFPADHFDTLLTKENLGRMYVESDQPEKAAQVFDQLLEINQRLHGNDHPDTLKIVRLLGSALYETKDYQAALPHLELTFERLKKKSGINAKSSIDFLIKIVKSQCGLSDFDAARNLLESTLKQLDPTDDDWTFWRLQSRLGYVLRKLGETDQAETKLLEAYDHQKLSETIDEKTRRLALVATSKRLADLYEGTSNESSFDHWQEVYLNLKSNGK